MSRIQPFFSTIEQLISSLHLAEIQVIIRKELKGKSGIYGFLCKSNNKLYIGSSIDLSIRFNNHIKGSNSNILLQNAINKYNLHDFIYIVFEYCEPEDLILREQFYIDSLKPEFNILQVAGSLLGYKHSAESIAKFSGDNHPRGMSGKIHSAESKALMSEAKIGEKHPNYGRVTSVEILAKMSAANKGKTHTPVTKALITEALKGNNNSSKKIFVYSFDAETKETILYKSFDTCTEATKFFNCSNGTISYYLNKNSGTAPKLFKKQYILSTFLITKEL